MEEITPELVARVASRLYNARPDAATLPFDGAGIASSLPTMTAEHLPLPSGAPHLPSMPHMPSTPSSAPSVSSVPFAASAPLPLSSASDPLAHRVLPARFDPATLFGASNYSVSKPPVEIPASEATPTLAPQSSPGLTAFVQSLRGIHFQRGASGLETCPRHSATAASPVTTGAARPLDVNAIRRDFPILRQKVHGQPLAWLDNAATTQKPQSVIDAISRFYENDNSNIHRAAHTLAARATDAYEGAREKVQRFLGASSIKEIVFVRGTTEGINLIAQTYGRKFLQPGDEIVMSVLEHHANIVPWQMIAKEKGAVIRVIPVNDNAEIMLEEYQKILGPRTKVVALTQASNSLGTILPVHEMTQMAKRYGARVLIDGAQSVAHIPVNLQELGCDFFVFSGHKIFGPTGIGATYIKEELHDVLPPWQGGGNMIRNVTFEETSYSEAPAKFEAGTPNIADVVGLGAALDYVSQFGLTNIAAYEHHLLQYATERMTAIPGLRLIGTAREKVGVLSFVLPNRRTEDVGRYLDQHGIAVRSGHHCSQPSLRRFGVETTVRPSLSFYNTTGEVDRLVHAIQRLQRV